MPLLAYDDDDRRYLSGRIALLLAVLAAVITGALVLLAAESRSEEPPRGVEAPTPAAGVSEPCRLALERAEVALDGAQRVREALAEQTGVMNDLTAGRLTADEAVLRAQAGLDTGARDSLQLDVARQRFDEAARLCRSVS